MVLKLIFLFLSFSLQMKALRIILKILYKRFVISLSGFILKIPNSKFVVVVDVIEITF